MNQRNASTSQRLDVHTMLHAARVFLPVGVCYTLLAGPVYLYSGSMGLAAAGVAALACALSSVGAAAAAMTFSLAGQDVTATVTAMLVRMALPLVFAITVCRQPGPLVDNGLAYYLVGFYMVMLAADTHYAVGRIQAGTSPSKGT